MSNAIVLLSGGIDSATALWWAKRRWRVYALTFKFGNLNTNEVRSARKLAAVAKVIRHMIVDLKFLKQMSELDIPPEVWRRRHFPPTYIPSRNTAFFGIASHYAEIYGAKYIVTGHMEKDPFPDSKRPYLKAMNVALSRGSWLGRKHRTRIVTPFARLSKASILGLAVSMRVPLEYTWSCHWNRRKPCRKCEGCVNRSKSFKRLRLINGS